MAVAPLVRPHWTVMEGCRDFPQTHGRLRVQTGRLPGEEAGDQSAERAEVEARWEPLGVLEPHTRRTGDHRARDRRA